MEQKRKYKSIAGFLRQLNDYDRKWLRTNLILLFLATFVLGITLGIMFSPFVIITM